MADVRPSYRMDGSVGLAAFTSPTRSMRNLDSFAPPSDALSPFPGLSPTLERRNNSSKVVIRLRNLPRNLGVDALRSMLIFAKDFEDAKFTTPERVGRDDYSCALATFKSEAGALEAQERLNGKPNTTSNAIMIVELVSGAHSHATRNAVDGTAPRQQSASGASSTSPDNPLSRQSSRYSSSFQTMNKVSPPLGSPTAITNELPSPSTTNQLQTLFSPQSPVANAHSDYHRISGKSLINDGIEDDDTEQMLSDPLGYAQNGRHPSNAWANTVSQFGNLSLNTSAVSGNPHYMTSPGNSVFTSPQSVRSSSLQSPSAASGPGTNGVYPMRNMRPNPPAANPADQNPPCNTLYVGNLPNETNEDELKQLFSRQRGFRRLCFRTKHERSGPMCFVEFEDITTATRTLNELYGAELANSHKGGVRLSYSKNPLGVRSERNGIHHAAMAGYHNGMGAPPGFSTANGPPPGLGYPSVRGQPTYGASPMQAGVGRGQAPRLYAGANTQGRPQQGINGYSHAPPNGASGQYPYASHGSFGNTNVFSDYPNGNGPWTEWASSGR